MAKYTIVGNTKVTSSANVIYRNLTIPATSNQTYTLTLTKGSLGTLPKYTSTATSDAQTLSVPYGTSYKISYTGNTGYNGGADKSGTVNGSAVSVTHNAAVLMTKNITIPAPVTGIASYTIKVTKGSLGSMPTYTPSGGSATSLTSGTTTGAIKVQSVVNSAPYGSTVLATWTPTTGYGLSKTTQTETVANTTGSTYTNPTAGVIYQSVTIPKPTGIASFTITLTKGALGTLPSGYTDKTAVTKTAQTTVKIPYGTKIDVVWTSNAAYGMSKTTSTYTHNVTAYTWSSGEAIAAAKTLDSELPSIDVIYKSITIPAVTTGVASYTVMFGMITVGSLPSGYTSGTPSGAITAATTLKVPYGASMTVTYTAADNYHFGSSNDSKTSSIVYINNDNAYTWTNGEALASALTLSTSTTPKIPTAALNTYTYTVTMTAGAPTQKVTVVGSKAGTKEYTSSGSFTATHGETWTAMVATTNGGTAGTLSAKSGTVSGAYTLTCSAPYYGRAYLSNAKAYDENNTIAQGYANQTYNITIKTMGVNVACNNEHGSSTSSNTGTTNGLTQCGLVGSGVATRLKGTSTAQSAIYGYESSTVATAIAGKVVYATNAYTTSSNVYSVISYKKSDGTWVNDQYVGREGFTVPTGITSVKCGTIIKAGTYGSGDSYTDYVTGIICPTMTKQTWSASYKSQFWAGTHYGDTWTASLTPSTGYSAGQLSASSGTFADATVYVSASKATLITKTLTLPAITTGIASYTIKVTLNTTYSSTMPTCKSSDGATTLTLTNGTAATATSGKSYVLTNVPYGATVLQTWTATTGYSLSKSSQTETVANTTASTFTNPTASVITKTITIPAVTTGIASYTIKLTKGTLGSLPSGYTSGTATAAKTAQTAISGVPYGTTCLVTWTATTGYSLSKTTQSETVANSTASTFTNPTASVITKTITVPAVTTGIASYTIKLTKGTLGTLPSGYTSGTATGAKTAQTAIAGVPYGTTCLATWTATTGYSLSKTTQSETVANATASTFTNPTASLNSYTVTFPAKVTGISKVTATIIKKGSGTMPSGWTDNTAKDLTSATSNTTVKVPYGFAAQMAWTASTGYNLSKTSETVTTVNKDYTFTNPTVTVKTYSVTVPAVTTGIASYKITITKGSLGTMPSGYTSGTASAAKTAATTVSVPHGSTVKVDWTASSGYTLSKTTETGSSLTAAKTFTNPTATENAHTVSKVSSVTQLTTAQKVAYAASATVGDYALFAGGTDSLLWGNLTAQVISYNTSLTKGTPTALSKARQLAMSGSVGNYALFAGGFGGSALSTVDAYNTSLTRSTPTALSYTCNGDSSCIGSSTASVGSYVLFGGTYTGSKVISTVNAYNASLTRSTPTALSVARGYLARCNNSSYALFLGGDDESKTLSTVDAYNSSLTRSTPTALSVARSNLSGTTIGTHAIVAGGSKSNTVGADCANTVDAYNTSLTRSTPTALSVTVLSPASASTGHCAVFAGGESFTTENGQTTDAITRNNVAIYNDKLTKSTGTALSSARGSCSGGHVNKYAIIFGGSETGILGEGTTKVDVYTES